MRQQYFIEEIKWTWSKSLDRNLFANRGVWKIHDKITPMLLGGMGCTWCTSVHGCGILHQRLLYTCTLLEKSLSVINIVIHYYDLLAKNISS